LDVDRTLGAAIGQRFNAHAVLSEEASVVYRGAKYTWVIDPLDGTTNFAAGLPIWGTSIALLYQGEPVVGVLDFPLLQQRYKAARGVGAWMNGRRLQVTPVADLHANQLIATDSRSGRHVEIALPPKRRILGSAAFELAAVAAGTVIASLQVRPKIWDLAAAWLILQEAGGVPDLWLAGPGPFPLAPGGDYGDRDFPVLFAADPILWQRIKAASRLRPGANRLVRRLKAQGWLLDR
jgi:myo-inositol-1(or 4)-monophosphatase